MELNAKVQAVLDLKRRNLNNLNQEIVYCNDIENIKSFVKNNPAPEYCMRDLDSPMGQYFFAKDFEQIIEFSKNYDERFLLCVSARSYVDQLVLLGDIRVDKENNIVDLTARTDKSATHRNIYENPEFRLHTTLDDDKLWDVPGFLPLIDYISKNSLFNMIVEFGVYNIPLGTKNEKVAIYEIRTNY